MEESDGLEEKEIAVMDNLTFQIFELFKMQTREPTTVCCVLSRCLILAALAANVPQSQAIKILTEQWDSMENAWRTNGD